MRKSNTNTTKNRCSLWGTKAIAITSILLAVMSGCGHDRMDTEPNPPNNVKETMVCTTNTTISTSKVSTTTTNTTTTTTMMSMTTTTGMTAKNTFHATEIPKKNTTIVKTETVKTNSTITEPITTESTTTETIPVEEYVVYKPSTHYIHKNTCHWNSGDAYKIGNTEGIEVRRCSECNPDMEIVNEYIPPVINNGLPITETERILLCNLVGREYGSDWVSIPEKAKVVAVVMNRVNDPRFPNTIYEVLTQPYQFSGYVPQYSYTYQVTDSVIEAVNYYFAHPEEFGNWIFFEGDGTWNHFS